MRLLLQRVREAGVTADGERVATIGPGLLVFVGVGRDDAPATVTAMARRAAELRIFRDDDGRTNRSLLEVGGGALVVSQFTLYADTARGRRPGFTDAAEPEVARVRYEQFAAELRALGVDPVATGRFGAEMAVSLVNDGPFTIWLDSRTGTHPAGSGAGGQPGRVSAPTWSGCGGSACRQAP